MRPIACLLALFAAGCSCASTSALPDATPVDAAMRDGGVDALVAPTDSAVDASYDRPDWLPQLAPACGASSYDVDDVGTFDTRAELARAVAEARCAYGIRCGTLDVIDGCDPIAVRDGAYVTLVDPVLAARCLRAWEQSGCAPDEGTPEAAVIACLALEWGRAAPGEPCSGSDDCAGYCVGGTGAACIGTCAGALPMPCPMGCATDEVCTASGCRSHVAIGAACDADLPCELGARCEGGVCLAYPAEGASCLVVSGPITATFCGPGLACDVDLVCRAPHVVAFGHPCGGASSCEAGTYCANVCRRPGTSAGDGCIPSVTPLSDPPRCTGSLYCASDSTCQPRRASGQTCDTRDACASPSDHCIADYDVGTPSICAHYVAAGCACDATTMCTPEHECRAGICARRGTFARACTIDGDCFRYGGTCVDGSCATHFVGDPCGPGELCFEGRCSAGQCVPLRENGETCRTDDECSHPETCAGGHCHSPVEGDVCPTP